MSLISLAEARALLLDDLSALGTEETSLDDALGRTLAMPVIASQDQPVEPRATMDGIAVPDAEPVVGTRWKLVGDAPAGQGAPGPLKRGEAVRIATGAVVPTGAARVLQQEIVQFEESGVVLSSTPGPNRFFRRAGADFKLGERLIERGICLGPAALGLIAAANRATVQVFRKPRIAICTVGDELVAPGAALGTGQSVDSASHALRALIRCWGGAPQTAQLLPDELHSITAALTAAAEQADIVLCVGGASVGARDLMRPAAKRIGAQFRFEGIAVQPGKPCWHARHENGTLLLGLPGNPTSALVCAHLLLLPLIERLMERSSGQALRPAYLSMPIPANGDREQYLRAAASLDGEGRLLVTPLADQDSGLQANLARAHVLIRRLAGAGSLVAGDKVEVLELTTC